MSFHSPVRGPSPQALITTRCAIVLAVLVTTLLTTGIVQWRSQQMTGAPEPIPMANLDIWRALGR